MTIIDFLHARITEDEEIARAAKLQDQAIDLPRGTVTLATHLAMLERLTPDRVLAECWAKRRIVDWCSGRDRVWVGGIADDPTDPKNYAPGGYVHPEDAPVLRMLAVVYAGHPDYQEAWRL